ncbi:amidohydrolase [Aliikangiella sp. G2MR2-5]|uniref:amidohydrolase n=1 Tax=Aliikangiella sp. G2MR2-5 TaxID=2788943 RepID=UPI0018AC269F|nr:amidohydrolase [Aliikangiella sp. G2MR2-5]
MKLYQYKSKTFKFLIPIIFIVTPFHASSQCLLVENIVGYTPTAKDRSMLEFSWLKIIDGKVVSTGQKIRPEVPPNCSTLDGKGQFVLPGLIDAHGHVSGLGNELMRVILRGTKSENEAVERVIEFEKQNPQAKWILGRGWNQVLWPDKSFPSKSSLDKTNIDKPILLRRIDGHAAWANSKALELAGINLQTPDPEGGKILRDEKGEATGVLIDNAMNLVESKIPALSRIEQNYAFDKAFTHLLSQGITSAHDAGVSAMDYEIYKARSQSKEMPMRVYGMLSGASPDLYQWLKQGVFQDSDDKVCVRSVKLYSDGALGSRGAAMLSPYSDDPDNKGLLVTTPEMLDSQVEAVLKAGFQVNVHAIGDKGNRNVLSAFEKAYKKVGGKQLRNRIEHAQVVALEDIPKFKSLDLIASMQPVHATSDMNMAEDRIGQERLKGAYAWQKFIQQGTIIASGSDFPVELANPFHGLHAAVTRQNHKNEPTEGWLPHEKMTPQQALRSFTLDAAFAAHQENKLGSLEPGKWADFILVDRDIIKGNPQEIWKTKVLATWVAGEKVYELK